MGCTPICYDNGKRKHPKVDDNKVGDNSQNKNLNKNLNNKEIYLENPTPIGSKNNKEENDKTNLGCDKTSIGASQNHNIVINDPHSNNIDKNIIQDLTDNKEPNEKDIKENNFQLCLCNNTEIQKKLFYNGSESLEISSGTMYMNSQVSIFGGNKSKYSAVGSRSNINNFQGKISKNYYIDGNLQIINEQEERN